MLNLIQHLSWYRRFNLKKILNQVQDDRKGMAKISNKQYAGALYEITKDLKTKDLTTAIETFAQLLVRDHKLKQAGNIIVEFERLVKKASGVVELKITSARELDNKTISEIKKVFGDKVEAVVGIDETLIGGVKVKLEDKILDASVSTQLKNLKHNLTS